MVPFLIACRARPSQGDDQAGKRERSAGRRNDNGQRIVANIVISMILKDESITQFYDAFRAWKMYFMYFNYGTSQKLSLYPRIFHTFPKKYSVLFPFFTQLLPSVCPTFSHDLLRHWLGWGDASWLGRNEFFSVWGLCDFCTNFFLNHDRWASLGGDTIGPRIMITYYAKYEHSLF